MLAGMSFGTDLKRYSSGVLPRIALVTIILMPLLYGAMYLWAFWNPFGAIDKMPVALVNADKRAVVDGKPVHAGDQVASSLLDSGQLLLSEVSEQDAAKGLADGRYYFTITIPSGFSKAVTSPSGGDPTQAKLRFEFNGARGQRVASAHQRRDRRAAADSHRRPRRCPRVVPGRQQLVGSAKSAVHDRAASPAHRGLNSLFTIARSRIIYMSSL